MKKTRLITTAGEVRPIEGRLSLEQAARLLEASKNTNTPLPNLDPIRGDLEALYGEKDSLYTFEGYEYGAATLFLMPRYSPLPNPKAKEILESQYNVFDTQPTGNLIITTLQDVSKDLYYNVNRSIFDRATNCPTLDELKALCTREKLVNKYQYFKFVEQHPELKLPYHPDFFYNNAISG